MSIAIRRLAKLSVRKFSSQSKFVITGSIDGTSATSPEVGQFSELQHVFTQEDVNSFAGLCGDNNPIHINPEFAKNSMFGGTIVHGIFTSSLFSTIFGRGMPGAIYVDQHLTFKRPVHVGKKVVAKVQVLEVKPKKKGNLLVCSTTCTVDGEIAVDGQASVLLPFK